MNINHEKNSQFEKVVIEIVKEINAIKETEIHSELLSEAQGKEDSVSEQMFVEGYEYAGKEINDGDVSDDMISERRSELVTSIIDSFILPYGAHDDIQFGKYWVSLGDGEYIEIAEEEKEEIVEKIYKLVN